MSELDIQAERLAQLEARVLRLEQFVMKAAERKQKEAALRDLIARITPELYDRDPTQWKRLNERVSELEGELEL